MRQSSFFVLAICSAALVSCAKASEVTEDEFDAGLPDSSVADTSVENDSSVATDSSVPTDTNVATDSNVSGDSTAIDSDSATNPCDGVVCDKPSANTCADTKNLTVWDSKGTCDQGKCTYSSHSQACPYGCDKNACVGDPCLGVTCKSPAANYCTDSTHLEVYDPAGTCGSGVCTYGHHSEFCSSGCAQGACKNDPCIGVTCNKPPANFCTTANALRTYTGAGSCTAGTCNYVYNDAACQYGCLNGVCKNCQVNTDCGASGMFCDVGTCKACKTDQHCGSSCSDCTIKSPSQICNGAGTTCLECELDSQCGAGKWCNNNVCASCNSAQHCGSTCLSCSGTTPDCTGTACACNATSCGTGARCNGTACATCDTATYCGPSCVVCSGTTPSCGGATAGCKCTVTPSDSCGGTSTWCNSGACTACGTGSCGNGRCDCGETGTTCGQDCQTCPVGKVIGAFEGSSDGWAFDGLWRYNSAKYMVAGSSTSYSSSYTQNLTSPTDVNLLPCPAATLSFSVKLADDPGYSSSSDKSERLYVQCSPDSGLTWTDMKPVALPAIQSACSTSFCSGGYSSSRAFGWTNQTFTVADACRTAKARFRFQAKGSSAWRLLNPGWYVDTVVVN